MNTPMQPLEVVELDTPLHSMTLRQALVELITANPSLRQSLTKHELRDEQTIQLTLHRIAFVRVRDVKEVLADLIMEEMRGG